MNLTTEYLIIVERASQEALYDLCTSRADFDRLLSVDPSLEVGTSALRFEGRYEFPLQVRIRVVEAKEQRCFYLRLEFQGEEDGLEKYSNMLRAVRRVIGRAGGHIETLWDDVSFHYCHRAYPLIHEVESLMRKLIAYFMLTTIGKEWIDESSPDDFKRALQASKRKQYVDVLHQVDFVQLGGFLFGTYQTRAFSDLAPEIEEAGTGSEVDLQRLKECIPRSNWDRYFSQFVECTSEHLNKSWRELYELRCVVAHNALLNRQSYEQIRKLARDVAAHLQKAMDNLDQIHVPAKDREAVAEQAAVNINLRVGEFVALWRTLETETLRAAATAGAPVTPFQPMVEHLYTTGAIDDEVRDELVHVRRFRNELLHSADKMPSEAELSAWTSRLRNLLDALRRERRWKDEIVDALNAHGGEAKLADIYEYLEDNSSRIHPENWKAVVRYTLQLNSSDTQTFGLGGGEDIFRHAGKGRWALRKSSADHVDPELPADVTVE